MKWKIWAGSALIGTSFFLANTTWAVNLVVFEAKGGGLKSGQIIDSTLPLTLADGERASLIADTGRIIRLKGPHNAPPLAEGSGQVGSVKEAMASLIQSGTKDAGALGATRSANAAFQLAKNGKTLPDPWLVDVTQGGSQCYQEGGRLILWRPEDSTDANIRVILGDDDWKARTDWPKGKSNLLMPANAPVRDGIRFTLEMDGKKIESVLHIVPGTVTSNAAKVAWMHEKGCKDQFVALLGTMKE